jgi:tetratricopeptide (TPR) repeat protein
LLRRLGVKAAWLGAALFALHPVCVESVAWITERKNALSGVFFLLSAWAAVEFWLPFGAPASGPARSKKNIERTGPEVLADCQGAPAIPHSALRTPHSFGPLRFYWLALALYVCALCGKTAVIGLPGVFLLLAWWKRGFWVRRDFVLILPFLICGLGMALITLSVENHLRLIGGGSDDWQLAPLQRLLIGGRAVWFYLEKIVWPHPLMFMYPRWNIQTARVLDYLPVGAAVAAFAFLWRKRNGWARPVLMALGAFVIILFPVLGAFNVFFYRYSFVCDHFQYLAMIGPVALLAAGIGSALEFFSKSQPLLKPAVCSVLVVTFGVLTWKQTGVYQNRETLWRDALKHNPGSWMAHDDLGVLLSQTGRFEEADYHYQTALSLRPNDHVGYYDMGLECAMKGDLDKAAQDYHKALDISPSGGLAHYELANVLARQEKLDEALSEYALALKTYPNFALAHYNFGNALAKKGRLDEAIQEYTRTLKLDPDSPLATFNLGNALAKKGDVDGAIQHSSRTSELQPANAHAHATLGRALATKGQVDQAIAHYRKALEIDPNSVEAMANLGNALLGQKRVDEAVGFYRNALRLNPNSAVLHYNLGAALSRQGNAAEAQEEVAQARQLQAGQSAAK